MMICDSAQNLSSVPVVASSLVGNLVVHNFLPSAILSGMLRFHFWQLGMMLLGSIMTTLQRSDYLIHGCYKPEKWKRAHTTYVHNEIPVCQATFGFIFGIARKHKIAKLTRHYLENGIANRVHKNSLFRTYNALLFDETTHLIKLLQNYAEQHVILLPGRIPGYKWDNIKLLSSSTSKMVGIIICVGYKNINSDCMLIHIITTLTNTYMPITYLKCSTETVQHLLYLKYNHIVV